VRLVKAYLWDSIFHLHTMTTGQLAVILTAERLCAGLDRAVVEIDIATAGRAQTSLALQAIGKDLRYLRALAEPLLEREQAFVALGGKLAPDDITDAEFSDLTPRKYRAPTIGDLMRAKR
jgi:hypothetical protein